MSPEQTRVIVVGAGPAGLAVGACLKRAGVPFVMLEQADGPAPRWREHYERLHLHTDKRHSAMPFRPFPAEIPTYPSRDEVHAYLAAYAKEQGLEPRYGTRVASARRQGSLWQVTTAAGEKIAAEALVVATGYNNVPVVPELPGQSEFPGFVRHSREYRNARDLVGKRVLVVGLGNTGGEIALDLAEQGSLPTVVVRSPMNVTLRDVAGIPAQRISILANRLFPPRVVDALFAPVLKVTVGDLSRYGIRKPGYGICEGCEKHGRIPLIDIGTVRAIREGRIHVKPAIERLTAKGARFVDGTEEAYDGVILATGYRAGLEAWLENARDLLDERGNPRWYGTDAGGGLYFVGFRNPITGALREIALEARRVAGLISRRAP